MDYGLFHANVKNLGVSLIYSSIFRSPGNASWGFDSSGVLQRSNVTTCIIWCAAGIWSFILPSANFWKQNWLWDSSECFVVKIPGSLAANEQVQRLFTQSTQCDHIREWHKSIFFLKLLSLFGNDSSYSLVYYTVKPADGATAVAWRLRRNLTAVTGNMFGITSCEPTENDTRRRPH